MAGRILVVDDYPNAAEILARLLSRSGSEVKTAHDGLHALSVAQDFLPDVMFLDIDIPKLNGFEVAQRIREQPWGTNMIVIGVTGWIREGDRERGGKAGFDAVLVKPVNYLQLKAVIAELFTRKGQSAPSKNGPNDHPR